MGFAGQVFAARVAVGLAMPSPKAFSQAGAMVGGFAGRMYGNLHKKSKKAAQDQIKVSQENLAAAKSKMESHSKSQDSFLESSANASISRLQRAYSGLGKSAAASAGSIKGLKSQMGKTTVSKKLFANVGKDIGDGKQYEQMMKNFHKMQKWERKEVLLQMKARQQALKGLIDTDKKKKELGDEGVKLVEAEMRGFNKIQAEFDLYNAGRMNADEEWANEKKENIADVRKAENELKEDEKELLDIENQIVDVTKKMTAAGSEFVVTMKQDFIEIVRESVSVLTAFYYKLNQNTQELIEFERELMNANSVFRVTNDELFAVGDQVVQFGQQFGLEMQNGATGLYQLASAGLSAADSATVLTETLKLAMAVQGDHNTISKIVTQTLFGFEMEMDRAAEVTDKFAYAIQKSLIEYQDLASAVKFALPFFTTTGQSIDQLLGALQILTNRALEAGIAGRGLRQGLAELAESIGDNTARFREFGVVVTDQEGNMLQLTEIAANFSQVLNAGIINDTELLTSLIEDLNVRGATAFVHLVQASDEFTEAVEATANAGGELDQMVRIQNEAISAQIQILKNNVAMMFLYRDAAFEGTDYLNAFHKAIVLTVKDFRDLIVTQKGGVAVLTDFGKAIQDFAITGVLEMRKLLTNVVPILNSFISLTSLGISIFKMYLIPLKLVVKALEIMGPSMTKLIISLHIMTKMLPITAVLKMALATATVYYNRVSEEEMIIEMQKGAATSTYITGSMILLGLKKLSTAETWKSIGAKIYELTIEKMRNVLVAISIGLSTLWWDAKVAENHAEIWSINLKELSTWALMKKIAMDSYAVTVMYLQIAAVKIYNFFTGQTLTYEWASFVIVSKNLILQEKSIFLRVYENIQKRIGIAWDRAKIIADGILEALTWKNITARIAENWAKMQSNMLGGQEFSVRLANIWGRITEFALQVKNTAAEWLGVIAKTAKLAVDMLWAAFQKVMVIAVYIIIIAVKLVSNFVEWAGVAAKNGTIMADIKSLIISIIKNAIMIVATVVIIIQTLVNWAWVASVIAGTFGLALLVLGIISFIALLVVMAKKMNEQFDLWFHFKLMMGNLLGMILWFPKLIIGFFSKLGEKTYEIMEGPLFKLGLFLSHLFKMIMYYVKLIGNWIMDKIINPAVGAFQFLGGIISRYFIDPIIWAFGKIKEFIEGLKNPIFTLKELIVTYLINPIKRGLDAIGAILNAGKKLGSGVIKIVKGAIGLQEGGYVTAMAGGGQTQGAKPYFVGEKGPELFMPKTSGKVVPNKDLNTSRVRDMLSDAFRGRGRGRRGKKLVVDSLEVNNFSANSFVANKTAMAIDSFAGKANSHPSVKKLRKGLGRLF